MSIDQAETRHRILVSDVVPVHVAGVLRHMQAVCELPRGMAITLAVDESLYASADPDLLVYALGILLSVTCLDQPDSASIALICEADDGGVRIQAEGTPAASGAGSSRPARPIALDLTFAGQAIMAMNGALRVGGKPGSGTLFRLSLPLARPSRISSRPPTEG